MANQNINLTTGLCTYDILKLMLFYELERVQRYPMPVTLLRIGVARPDESISEEKVKEIPLTVAHVLNSHLRAADVPGHCEDDFLVILSMTDESGGRIVARRLAELLVEGFAKRSSNEIKLKAYVGLTSLPQGKKVSVDEFIAQGGKLGADEFIAQATHALTEARQQGPGSVVLFSDLP